MDAILKADGIGLDALLVRGAGLVDDIALLVGEAVAGAGIVAGVEADKVGAVAVGGGLELVAVAAVVAAAVEVPVGRDAVEADVGGEVKPGAVTALVGVEVSAALGRAGAGEEDVDGRGAAGEADEEELDELHGGCGVFLVVRVE